MVNLRWMVLMILIAASFGLMACVFPLFLPLSDTPDQGTLKINIDYTGRWYRDTFDYTREAENIRHFVLIIPEDELVGDDAAGWVFTGLNIQPDGVNMTEDRQQYAWALDYLYDAPQGYFAGEFEPGTYAVAVAFIAEAITAEQAGAGLDAILWAGVTGGGASTDYEAVTIEAGKTTDITIPITDDNGWACPWLYVYNGHTFERRTEILRNVRDMPRTEITPLGSVAVTNGWVIIRISEENDEVTVIDSLFLLVDGVPIHADADPATAATVAATDGDTLILRKGDTIEFRFPVPFSFAGDNVALSVTGYYIPGE